MKQATHRGAESEFYLKEDAYFEPLLHKWYVWPYLLAPIPAALNFSGRYVRLMKSFLANAHLHISAGNTPALAGGDFVNCSTHQIEDVRRLVHELETDYSDYFAVRDAVAALNALLEQQNGHSMESVYEQVPSILRGYVELVYDMNHHASFRLIEGLLYHGSLYKRCAQSARLGLLSIVKQRPFVLSSPRLSDENHIEVKVGLADRWLDALFALRIRPAPRQAVDDLFGRVAVEGGLPFGALFTTHAPSKRHKRVSAGVKVSYLGHAGLLIQTARVNILVDPVIASRDGVHDDNIISFSELPEFIDYVCITHTHMDHVCIETLIQLRHRIGQVLVPRSGGGDIADPSLLLMLQQLGFSGREFEDMQVLPCAEGRIMAVPFLGEHADLRIRSKTTWYFELQGRKVLCAADAAVLDESLYRRVHEVSGDLDMIFIGMECVGAPMSWLYGALFSKPVPRAINESRRFNGSDYERAKKLVEIFSPKQVCIYALGMEPWFRYFMGIDYNENARQIVESDRLLRFCAQQQVPAQRLFAKHVWNL